MQRMIQFLILAALLINMTACTWVTLTEEAEKVRVLSTQEVSQCTLLGRTTSNTAAVVAGVRRHDNAIQHELINLARNSAVSLGGDSIVAETQMLDGKQTFKVYRCIH